jgi:hypothetical protein
MSVGQFRRGGPVNPGRSFSLPSQPMLTAEQTEAICIAVGALTGFAADVRDAPLNEALTRAASTLQAMLAEDARARTR